MKKLIATVASLALTLGMLVATPLPALAAVQGAVCPSTNTFRAHFYENTIADNSDGDDELWICVSANANMANISHTPSGYCHGLFYHNDWGDCVSSAAFRIPSTYAVCLYDDPNYSGTGMRFNSSASGTRINLITNVNDQVNSFRYVASTSSC